MVDCRSACRRVCSAVQRESAASLYNTDYQVDDAWPQA